MGHVPQCLTLLALKLGNCLPVDFLGAVSERSPDDNGNEMTKQQACTSQPARLPVKGFYSHRSAGKPSRYLVDL